MSKVDSYASVKSLHASLPPFSPLISVDMLPYIALICISAFFVLTFTFSTLPKSRNPLPELGTGLLASGLAGIGIVALFCTVGVYV
ncbi:hypothetical protein BD324DRAFT_679564 [Kockovaella imperatae]|uniref:Dolichyl-diphosphooligosaccharide-protein glycosyltransferase subunit OST5 n=1 Tax=Kockovaella imperatae TaxID=4999 RepID=A0A1Y1ULY8_9TREE|nr:hypothetical protein BD324DRAFT_679564 [Kockovaella imperatae]ORX39061.1 hypothetical protein BD324DRAFT_679564 [Kockovaella imperatae]